MRKREIKTRYGYFFLERVIKLLYPGNMGIFKSKKQKRGTVLPQK